LRDRYQLELEARRDGREVVAQGFWVLATDDGVFIYISPV